MNAQSLCVLDGCRVDLKQHHNCNDWRGVAQRRNVVDQSHNIHLLVGYHFPLAQFTYYKVLCISAVFTPRQVGLCGKGKHHQQLSESKPDYSPLSKASSTI